MLVERRLIYDQAQTLGNVQERAFRIGVDYSFSIKYELEF